MKLIGALCVTLAGEYRQVGVGLYSPWALLHKWKYGGITIRRHSPEWEWGSTALS